MKGNIFLWKYLFVVFVCSFTLHASSSSKYEQEPNDVAVNATVFRGEVTLHGELSEKDTDHFLWKVSKKDTLRNWEMRISSVPKGSITITFSKVVFQKAGLSTVSFSKNAKELKSKTKIFSFKNDSGHSTQTLSPLVVEKGIYLVSLHSTRPIPYKLTFIKKEKVHRYAAKTQKSAKNNYLNSLYLHPSEENNAWFKFTITKEDSNKVWQINSSVTLAHAQSMSVVNENNEVIAKVDADNYGKMIAEDLELEEGSYYVHYTDAKNKNYALEVRSTGTQTIDKEELEPNNSIEESNTVPLNKIIHGSLGQNNDTRDYFSFKVPSDFKHKIFDIYIKSEDQELKVILLDDYNTLQVKSEDSNYTFSALALKPKQTYYLEVYKYSKDANYSISFSKPYIQKEAHEIEPNDTANIAQNIENNQTTYGKFVGEEMDCSSFLVPRNNLFWSILTKGNSTKKMSLYHKGIEILRTSEQVENTLRFENLFLTKGNYALCIMGKNRNYQTSISHKRMKELNITTLKEFEQEPNQNSSQANHLDFGKTKKGLLETVSNEDFFYFTLKNTEHIRLTTTPPKDRDVHLKLIGTDLTQRAYLTEGNVSVIEGVYPAGRYVVELSTQKPSFSTYVLMLERLNPFTSKDSESNLTKIETANVTLKLDSANNHPRSYYHLGQILDFTALLKNDLDETQKLFIRSHSSDKKWHILCPQKSVVLLAQEEKSLSCHVQIPKNVSSDEVIITLQIENIKGKVKNKSFTLMPKDTAYPLHSYKDWNIPKELLGTLNVARVDLGAKRVIEHNETSLGLVANIGKYYHYLFDDIVYNKYGFYLNGYRKNIDENVSIKLVQDSEIRGVALNLKGNNDVRTFLKDFSIWLSEDGTHYKKVYTGSLKKTFEEQFFTFKQSHNASYAKLTLHNNQNKELLGRITLGEWKVLASQTGSIQEKIFNIANPKLGGHIVSTSKFMGRWWDMSILTEEDDVDKLVFDQDETSLTWVLGFKNERVAKLTHMVWKEAKKSRKKSRLGDVKLFVSTQTPTGPWEEVGLWERNTTLENNTSAYTFEKPTWARYVKFSVDINRSGYYNPYYPPESLEVYEEKPSDSYKSILGEWGDKNHESFYEYLQNVKKINKTIITGNEEKGTAYPLDENISIYGEVSVAKHQKDWYKVTIPKGMNQLTVTLKNNESVDVNYLLYDNNTKIQEVSKETLATKHKIVFPVHEGEYYLNIHQSPVNVIFAWDNSGSVSPYKVQITAAVNAYVNQIEENIDNVNLLCFNTSNRFILSDFANKKEEIETIFHDFDWSCNSSDAEASLSVSTQALKSTKGIKGIIIIADADGNRYETLWESLNDVRPKVFSIRVASSYDNRLFEGVMQSWSRVNNGTYAVVENATEMAQAINHAAHVLRRPVFYDVRIKTDYVRPLGKGSLVVLKTKPSKVEKKKVDKNFAIELILDASGSMLKRIKGKRRIEIAKDVLVKAVQEIIPHQTLVALRVFGHKKADSCRTDLEMRLQALNVRKTSKIIKRIKAKNLAKTPIAASLAKVASDLSSAHGKKVIILVTDGKETCEGDPAKEIEKLKEKGIDIRLNIVGFAIDDDKLKKEFESWAKLGNGEYFEANDKKSLDAAVKKALQIPYSVYTSKDELIFKGVVGDEGLKLKGGLYKVVVEGSPKQVFDEVHVIGEEATILDITKQQKRKK